MRTSKLYKIIGAAAVLLGTTQQAEAILIVGNHYQDSDGAWWEFLGTYNVGDGPSWPTNFQNPTAVEIGETLFPTSGGRTYAISTSDTMVDHLAWYDGYGTGIHLPTYNTFGGGVAVAEDFFADVGNPGYNESGDFSPYIGNDRAAVGGGAFNHVFASVNVPEAGCTMAMLGIAIGALAIRRKP